MMEVKVFNNEEFGQVRTVARDEDVWFVAKDICDILGLTDGRKSVQLLDEDDRNITPITDSLGRKQQTFIINESGMYSLILRSRKPEAKKFKKWVTSEVLPSIRKHGAYMTPDTIEATLNNPDFIIGLATRLKEEQEKNGALVKKIEADKPKVEFADTVSLAKGCIGMKEFADLLGIKGLGRNNLMKWLRNNNFLNKRNEPYRRYVDGEIFETKESLVTTGHNSYFRITTKITGKGQAFLYNKIRRDKDLWSTER